MQSFFNVARRWMGGSEEEKVYDGSQPWHCVFLKWRGEGKTQVWQAVLKLESKTHVRMKVHSS